MGDAKIVLDGREYPLPTFVGTEGEKSVDIGKLRATSEYVCLDPAFVNTASCKSAITFIDGDKGILRYRGYNIEDLCRSADFVETSYLLIYGELPTKTQLKAFSTGLIRHSLIHEEMKHLFQGFPSTAHPMANLSAMVCSLSAYYPDCLGADLTPDMENENYMRLLSKLRTIAAFSYKKFIGQPPVYPRNDLSFCANFLHMMFAVPAEPYEIDPELVKALNLLLIAHADHEQNCSTSTVRLVGSSRANVFASISAGICALWGPLHGGANQAVVEMLEGIVRDGGDVKKYVDKAKDKSSGFRLMGFGHRVYKNFDPRAKILKEACDRVLSKLGIHDPLLDVAKGLEEAALRDDYFVSRKLYPNVDFYSGILYRAMKFPTNMFTVMFALGRLPGWIAHYKEMKEEADSKIGRPRQIYTGPRERPFVPLKNRV